MAKPVVVEFPVNAATATKAVVAAIARLGYNLKNVDNENGLIVFETGMSMKSWAGQSMSVHIFEATPGTSQLTIGGKRNAHGAQMQIYDWGEANSIAKKIIDALKPSLGTGKTVSSGGGACFVATAVYGNYSHPAVLVLRRFRDETLKPHPMGRGFIKAYYRRGPGLAAWVSGRPWAKRFCRSLLDRIVDLLSR